MDGYRPFQKYSSITGTTPGLFGRPEGRPVGVRTGMGTQPNVPSNPILGGLRTSPVPLPGMSGGTGLRSPLEPYNFTGENPLTMPTQIPGLGGLTGQLQRQPPISAQQNVQSILNKYGMSQQPGTLRPVRGGY
jgi:hypothetical protein